MRDPHFLRRPGRGPGNQIAGTAEEQLRRAQQGRRKPPGYRLAWRLVEALAGNPDATLALVALLRLEGGDR